MTHPSSSPYRLVIEFDNEQDYNEFIREHFQRRCSDLTDWNSYHLAADDPTASAPSTRPVERIADALLDAMEDDRG